MPNAQYLNMLPSAAGTRNVRAYNNNATKGPITAFVSPNSVSAYGWESDDVAAPCPGIPGFEYNITTGTYSNIYKTGNAAGTYNTQTSKNADYGQNETIPPTITPNSRGPFPGWEIDNYN